MQNIFSEISHEEYLTINGGESKFLEGIAYGVFYVAHTVINTVESIGSAVGSALMNTDPSWM